MHIHRIQIHIKQMHSKTSQRQRMQPIENGNDEWVGICPFPTSIHVYSSFNVLNLSHAYPNAIRGLQFALQ